MGSVRDRFHGKQHTIRYLRSESAIARAIFKRLRTHRGRITIQQIADDVGLRRQSIYGHYHNVNDAIVQIEDDLVNQFSSFVDARISQQKTPPPDINRFLFHTMFIFMSQHKKIFYEISVNPTCQAILLRMMESIYPELEITWLPKNAPAPRIGSERVDLYFRMAIGVICRWGTDEHCRFERAAPYITKLLRLTENASQKSKL